ncbi:MAG: nicotinate-nucleotide adenylyltransferase [Pseudomonadota bacterium]
MTQPARRIGVFGGSFDPPHNTHVALVNAAVAQLGLHEVRVFPTGQAWHKPRVLSAAPHRLAMARLAFDGVPRAMVDDREIRRPGPTYTIDTLRELQLEHPGAQLYLLMGADQAAALPQWREWHEIIRIAIISVAGRSQSASNATGFGFSDMPGGRFAALDLPPTPVSATEIRQRVLASLGIAHLVPGAVARYIEQHHLYLAS